MTGRTLPVVQVAEVDKTGVPVAICPPPRMLRHKFKNETRRHEEKRIAQRQKHFGMNTCNHDLDAVGSRTSVNRMSNGCPTPGLNLVRQTPSQVRYTTGKTPPTMKTASPGRRSHSRSLFVRLVR